MSPLGLVQFVKGPYEDIVKKYVDAHGKVAAIKIALELGVQLADVVKSLTALAEKGHLRVESMAKMPRLRVPSAPTFGRQHSIFAHRRLDSVSMHGHWHPLRTYSEEFFVRKMERTPREEAYIKNVRELRKIKEEFLRAMKEQGEL